MDRIRNGSGNRPDWHSRFAGAAGRFVGQDRIRIEACRWNRGRDCSRVDAVLARGAAEEPRYGCSGRLEALLQQARNGEWRIRRCRDVALWPITLEDRKSAAEGKR